METVKKFSRRWGPAVVMMTAIYLASDTPGPSLPHFDQWDLLVKKGGHALGYALLGMAYAWGLAGRRPTGRALIQAGLWAAAYAVTDELHQTQTPGRSPSPVDVGLDMAGAVTGISLWGWAWRLIRANDPSSL